MSDSRLTKDEIARRGREIYEREIRAEVEGQHDGEFLVIDVATAEYAIGEDEDEVFTRAEGKDPKGLFYLMRVGHRAAHRIGGSAGPR